MSNPQDPNPWQPNPEPPPYNQGGTAGAYEVIAVNNFGPPMPPAPEPPLDQTQWQNPAGAYPGTPPGGQYQVNQVANSGYAMPPLSPVLAQEMAPGRPATITAAMWIWIAGAVLSVAVVPVMLLANADFFYTQDVYSEEDRRAAELGLNTLAVVFGFAMLVAASPYVAFAIVLRNGQNWARVLLTILGVLGFVSMIAIIFLSIGARVWQPSIAISIVVIGLTIAAVVLQFLPASNRFVR